ncbi:MAG TPA: hypothetical protein VJN01_03105, partial [Xanthomonadales bacterium]|nr:hypothetical protein [Xanthomonadales bacterium]
WALLALLDRRGRSLRSTSSQAKRQAKHQQAANDKPSRRKHQPATIGDRSHGPKYRYIQHYASRHNSPIFPIT